MRKKMLVIGLLLCVLVPTLVLADITMVAMKSNGGGEYIVWHPDGTVSLYVHKTIGDSQSLVKVKSLNPTDYPLESNIKPVDGVSGYER